MAAIVNFLTQLLRSPYWRDPVAWIEVFCLANLSFLSLWYTLGRNYGLHEDEWKMSGGAAEAQSILVASEPLTRDTSAWVELPEYGAMFAERRGGRPYVSIRLLD